MGKLVYMCLICFLLYLEFDGVLTQTSSIDTNESTQSSIVDSSTGESITDPQSTQEQSPSTDVDLDSTNESTVDSSPSNIPESTAESEFTQEQSSSDTDPNGTSDSTVDSTAESESTQELSSSSDADPNSTSESTVDSSSTNISESTQEQSSSDTDSNSTSESTSSPNISESTAESEFTQESSSSSDADPNNTSESTVDPSFATISESTAESESTQESSSSTDPNSTSESSVDTESSTDLATDSTETVSTTTNIPTTPPPRLLTQTRFTWNADKAKASPSQVVTTDPGFYISVTVSDVELTDDSYLLVVSGTSYTDTATDGRVFANSVAGPRSYLFQTNEVYVFFNNAELETETEDDTNKFKVVFERVGDLTTSVSTTYTTPINWPSTEESDSVFITVHINSQKLEDYSWEVINSFRNCVALMAIQYCEKEQIQVTDPGITFNNVLIQRLEECPYSWPNRDNCVQIRFRLPIFYNTSALHDGYLLTTNHLERMWLLYGKSDQCFKNNNFSVYSEPDLEKSITWWAIGISLVTVLFIILLCFLKVFSSRYQPLRRPKGSNHNDDTESIISSKKDSLSSLSPHYLQEHMDTPKFFDA